MAHPPPQKRQYLGAGPSQSSITSFFSPTPSHSALPTFASSSPPPLSIPLSSSHGNTTTVTSYAPRLPTNIQSNLLSVGMRIRKSISEGYKTGSAYNGFSLFSESPVSPCTVVPAFRTMDEPFNPGMQRRLGRAKSRELTPFCGLHKVGGLGVQSAVGGPDESGLGLDMAVGMDDCPPLSSQGSTGTVESVDSGYGSWEGSVVSTGTGNNKRRYDLDDIEDAVHRSYDSGLVFDARGNAFLSPGPSERPIKVLRKTKTSRKVNVGANGHDHPMIKVVGPHAHDEQENLNADFGDAEFLDYGLADADAGAGEEVEMSDV